MRIYKKVLAKETSASPIMAYALLMSISFDEDWYWKNFLKGISVKKSLHKKQNLICAKILRDQERLMTEELFARHSRFKNYLENKKSIEDSKFLVDTKGFNIKFNLN